MYRSGIQIPKVSFSSLTYDKIALGSFFLGFDLDSGGKLAKLDNLGNLTIIEGGGGPIEVQQDGTVLTTDVRLINFTGSLVSSSVNGQFVTIDLSDAGGTVSSVGLSLGTAGNDANIINTPITSSGNIILNLPTASGLKRGLLSSADWTIFNNKQNPITISNNGSSGPATLVGNTLNIPIYTSSNGTVRSVDLTIGSTGNDISVSGAPITSVGTININIPSASASSRGVLTSADWSTFNGKIGPSRNILTTSPLQGGGDLSADRTISIVQAGTSSDGYLSSVDWNIFNSKLSGSGTLNHISKFTPDGATIGDSQIIDDGSTIAIGTNLDTSIKVNVATSGFKQYAAQFSATGDNGSGGNGVPYPVYGVNAIASNPVQVAIGGRFEATGANSKFSLQLVDGTEHTGRFLKSIDNSGSANWADIEYLTYSTREEIYNLITANSLIPGMWYHHSYEIEMHNSGGLNSNYQIILQAVSSNKLSISGKRIMRVPIQYTLETYYFNEDRDYYVDDIAVFGNTVYRCIVDAPAQSVVPMMNVDYNYFEAVPISDDNYYETRVFDIVYNWDYTSSGDWNSAGDHIEIQSDTNGNIIRRTTEINGFSTFYIQQSTIDLHEWSNIKCMDNHCYGVWYNRQSNLSTTGYVRNNRLGIQQDGFTNLYGRGVIWRNKVDDISDNKGGSIYQNWMHQICRNTCLHIYNNSESDSNPGSGIVDNSVTFIYDNRIYGPIASNIGNYYYNSDGYVYTEISNNHFLEGGIIGNEINAGGKIKDNWIINTIRGNKVFTINQNGTEFEPLHSINYNIGHFIIKLNQAPVGQIIGNKMTMSEKFTPGLSEGDIWGIVYNFCRGSICYNDLLEGNIGIYYNRNDGEIIGNRVVSGISNNGPGTSNISYNDAYSIENNG